MLGGFGSLIGSSLTDLLDRLQGISMKHSPGGTSDSPIPTQASSFAPSSEPQPTSNTPPPPSPSTPLATTTTTPPQVTDGTPGTLSLSSLMVAPAVTPLPPTPSPPPWNSSGPTTLLTENTITGTFVSPHPSHIGVATSSLISTSSPTSSIATSASLFNFSSSSLTPISSTVFLSNTSSTPPSITTSTPPASLHSGVNSANKAAIAVSSLGFVILLALVVAFFIRRHRRKARAHIAHLNHVDGSERESNEMQFANRAEVTTAMSHERDAASTPDAFVSSRFPSPEQFEDSRLLPVSARQFPVEDLSSHTSSSLHSHNTVTTAPRYPFSFGDVSSHTSPALPFHDIVTPAPTDFFSFGDVSSHTSPSLHSHDTAATAPAEYFLNAAPPTPATPPGDVPFFHHLKAMRRRGELRKTPSLSKSYPDTEPSDDEEPCDQPKGNLDGQDHVSANIPDAESFTGFHAM